MLVCGGAKCKQDLIRERVQEWKSARVEAGFIISELGMTDSDGILITEN